MRSRRIELKRRERAQACFLGSFLCGVACLTTASDRVLAQPAPVATPSDASQAEPPPGYREAIQQALVEHEAHNYAEARALFLRAHELYPSARTLRGLGMMEFELRNYVACISRLEQALRSRVKPLDGKLRTRTEQLLSRARSFVARYELKLEPPVDSVRVTADDLPIELTRDRRLVLTVGEHVLRVQADGYHEEKRALSVQGGEARVLTIALRPLSEARPASESRAGPAGATQPTAPRDGDSLWSSPWLWAGAGAVVLGSVLTVWLVTSSGSDEEPEQGVGGVIATLEHAP